MALLGGAAGLVPKTVGGKLLGITVGSAVLTSPKVAKIIEPTNIVQTAIKGGEIVGTTIETGKPPVDVSTALKTGGLVAGGVVAGAGLVVAGKKIKEKIAELPKDIKISEKPFVPEVVQVIPEKAIGIEGEIPLTPETATISTGKKRRRRRIKKETPSVRQYVRVNIDNNLVSERYIMGELLCH